MDRRERKKKSYHQNDENKRQNIYWTNVFKNVVDIIQNTRKPVNGILTIKYISDTYNTRLRRMKSNGAHGTFHLPNLSFEHYEQLISLIAKEIIVNIKKDLKEAIYFSITIDPVPDTDESAVYIQYVNDAGTPIKHFLDIINKKANDALQIMDILHMVLDKYNLNHAGFMGLSYNINSNIPKHRASLKTCIKTINEYAVIVPCSRDSLSSVVIKAASSSYEGSIFFTTIDELFDFFMIFRYKWDDIKFLLKSMSYTRFSTKNKVRQCLIRNWSMIVNALFQLSENKSFKETIRIKAYLLLLKVKRLETCFITIFWEDIIEKITEFEERLHVYVSTQINFYEVFEIYQSLISYLNDFRTNEKYIDYKTRALQISNIRHFNNRSRTEKPQMRFPIGYLDESEQFKIKTYFYMIDEIQTELDYRKVIYQDLALKFNFLNKIATITDNELSQNIDYLQSIYLDLTYHISTECNELRSILNKLQTNLASIRDVSVFIRQQSYIFFFEELVKVVKMALCISASNCEVQHSIPDVLKKFKNSFGPITNEDTYKSLLIINMEPKLLKNLDLSCIIENMAHNQMN